MKFPLKSKTLQVDSPQECEHGAVRLVGGVTDSTGRLEFCARGMWGRVCNYHDYWGPDNTRVVCRQLGFSDNGKFQFFCMLNLLNFPADSYYKFPYDSKRYGSSERFAVIGEVYCTGTESELLECSHASIGKHRCYSEAADSLYNGDILISCYGMDSHRSA